MREPSSYSVDVTLTRVERASGFCASCGFRAEIRRPGQFLPTIMRTGVFFPTTGPKSFSDKRSVSLAPGQRFDLCFLFDTGSGCMPFGYPGAGAAGKFTYTVRKTAHF